MKFSVCIAVLGVFVINSAWGVRPVIKTNPAEFLPNQDGKLVVEAGNGFTLKCQADKRVNWTSFPMYEDDEVHTGVSRPSTISIVSSHEDNLEVSLRVNRSNFKDTGYYYCSTTDAKGFEDDANVENVYIYVKDTKHIMWYEGQSTDRQFTQFSTIVIPCRPTSPDVNMSLFARTQRIDQGYEREAGDNLTVSFDPTIGFILKNLNPNNSCMYYCRASAFGEEDERAVSISVV